MNSAHWWVSVQHDNMTRVEGMGRTLDEAVAALMVALEKRSADAATQLKEVAQTTGMAQAWLKP